LRAYLQGDAWFEGEGWHGVVGVQVGVSRKA